MGFFKSDNAALLRNADLAKGDLAGFANLPQPYKTRERREPDAEAYRQRLADLRRYPVRVLEEASNILKTLNRSQLKPARRFELVELLLKEIYPAISVWYDKYQGQQNSLPESKERREVLVAASSAVEQVAIAYKHLFHDTWSREPRRHRKTGAEVYRYGLYILEMVLLDQRLRALRYQKLPRSAWLDCNHVFFALALHDDLDRMFPLHGMLGLKKREAHHGAGHVTESSVRRLYLSLQLFGVLDVTTWPTHLFLLPHAYLESLNTGIEVLRDDGQPLVAGRLLTWLDNPGPARFERDEQTRGPALQLDYSRFYNAVARDYEAIASMKFIDAFDPRKLSRPLARINDPDRVPALQMMLTSLRHRQRRTRRHAVFQNNRVRVYFGSGEVLGLLTELAGRNLRKVLQSRKYHDKLTKLSPLLSSGGRLHSTEWQLMNFSAGGILLGTMETDFNTPVALGQLVAFIPTEDSGQPSLGFVCRLNRPQESMVEVGISRLANYAEVILASGIAETEQEDSALPAILLQDQADAWKLIVEQRDDMQPGMPLRLLRNDQTLPARLGEVQLNKKEFKVFALSSPGLQRR